MWEAGTRENCLPVGISCAHGSERAVFDLKKKKTRHMKEYNLVKQIEQLSVVAEWLFVIRTVGGAERSSHLKCDQKGRSWQEWEAVNGEEV